MRALSESYRAFGQFEVFTARNGQPSALHLPSGTLLHSRIDPAAEATDVAAANVKNSSSPTVIIGGGLGYLAEAVLNLKSAVHPVWVLEFDPAVHVLGRHVRPKAEYYNHPSIRVICATALCSLMAQVEQIPSSTDMIIAPYLLRLIEHEKYPLSDLLHIIRAERSSQNVYEPLLAAHAEQTRTHRSRLESVRAVQLPSDKMVVVAGAGPSLDASMPFIRQHRDNLVIIAASGAVPVLQAANIQPEWVIALEAQEAIVKDLSTLTSASSVVAFPSTHPAVFDGCAERVVIGGSEDETILETRGGTSVIPALDMALQFSRGPVLLIGVDLGHQNGRYARAAQRNGDVELPSAAVPPKFAAMRAGLERMLSNAQSADGRIFHILEAGIPLRGTVRLAPQDLAQMFETYLNAHK